MTLQNTPSPTSPTSPTSHGRFNILFVTSDQQPADFLGIHSPFFSTPHLDRLATEGVLLERSYTSCPVCTPSRSSWITGQYPCRHGAWSIGTTLSENTRTLPAILGEHGYETAIIGKSHLQSCLTPGTKESQPHVLDTEYFRNWDGPWYGFKKARINVGHTNEPHSASMHYRAWLQDKGVDIDRYFSPKLTMFLGSENIDDLHWEIPQEFHPLSWAADEAVSYLENHHHNHPDRPFYLNVNFPEPHGPDVVPSPYFECHRDKAVEFKPRRRFGEWEGKSRLYRAALTDSLLQLGWHDHANIPCMSREGLEITVENARNFNPTEKNRLRIKAAMMEMLDDKIGQILRQLERLGYADNTLVLFTSDHGDYAGAHYLWSKGGAHYDEAVRVPTIARVPKSLRQSGISQALFSNVDIAPTFLAAAGIDIPREMQGVSQWPALCNPGVQVRDKVWVDFRAERGLYINSLITTRYRLSVYSVDDGSHDLEFFDFEKDLDEFHNLIDVSEYQPVIRKMLCDLVYQRSELSLPWQERRAFA